MVSASTRVWIDLSNSPHALLFAPVARRLEELGHEVLLTARDSAQTVELARERWPGVEVIGGQSPPGRAAKAQAIGVRIAQLTRWVRRARADVALSHNSYAQIVAARAARIPVVTAMDYEHQPVNHLAFRLAHRVLLPQALAAALVRRQGARPSKVRHYPGLKEELYLGDFEPSRRELDELGVNGEVLVVARTPPSQATYHQFGNDLFDQALANLAGQQHVRVVALVRYPEQRERLAALGAGNIIVPTRAVDARSLVHHADLVLGAGGTMTREAAMMGVPTYTLFAGKEPAVDRWLLERGAMRRLTEARELASVRPRPTEPRTAAELRERAVPLVRAFVDVTLDAAARRARALP